MGLLILLAVISSIPLSIANAQTCSIEFFNVSPGSPVSLGTHVSLHGKGNCGTARFEINGQPRAEIGAPEQTETWKTEEFGAGTYNVCFVLRGDGGWENAARVCTSMTVVGNNPQPTSPPAAGFVCDQAFYDDMVAHFLQNVPPAPAYLDLNGDGIIDLTDYSICVSHWYAGGGGNPQPPSSSETNNEGNRGNSSGNNASQRGGMNIQAYCESIGYTGTSHGADAYSWVCTRYGAQDSPIDVDSVCRQNYGGALPYAGFTNQNDPGSWYCASEPQGRPGSGNSSQSSGGGSSSAAPLDYGSSTPFESYNLRINTTDGLNIRSGPGTNYSIIGRAVNGGNFEVINDTISGWYQIRFSQGAGWVSGAYVELNIPNSPSSSPQPPLSPSPRQCSITATSRYLGKSNMSLEFQDWRLRFSAAGIPFLEHNWILRVDLPGGYRDSIVRVERNGVDVTAHINLDSQLSTLQDSYIDLWIDGSWALANLSFRNQTNWTVHYECAS